MIKLSRLRTNSGQIEGLPENPRFIKDIKFKKLVQSIKDDPEMLYLRELLIYPFQRNYVIIGGNMRFRAMQELDYAEAPCKVLPKNTPLEKLKAYIIKDNVEFGENDFESLANNGWDVGDLSAWGMDMPNWWKEAEEEQGDANVPDETKNWFLNIKLDSEKKAQEMYEHLTGQGYEVKIVT